MPTTATLISFSLVALVMVITPGPNMIYYMSRSICQGQVAGLISLAGGITGLAIYMLCAAFGIASLVFAIPYAYAGLKIAGAAYLLYLAWVSVRRDGASPFRVNQLPRDRVGKLYGMGLTTVLLNPKVAIFYLSLLPQFIDPRQGGALGQSLALGFTHILLAIIGNGLFVLTAGSVAAFLTQNPVWLVAQRWFMGLVLSGVAIYMVLT
jgi:threonine/homoserine/homoserine lactone efflux protein